MAADVAPARGSVSVVVPLFNGALTIDETLTSIQRQTVPAHEVIVVDDGSSDDGAGIARNHPVGAVVLSQPNRGVAVARNHGLSVVTGGSVAFLDQDDLWHPTHLERTTAWLAQRPETGIVFVREIPFTVDEEQGQLRRMDALAGDWAQIVAPREGTLDHLIGAADIAGTGREKSHDVRSLLSGPVAVTTSFIADPQVLRLAGGFAPHALAMDDYWLLVNVARDQPIIQIDQPTVFYRVHVRATSRTTHLGLPFLSSAVALRLGGGIVSGADGIAAGTTGGLHQHLLLELLRSPEYAQSRFRHAVDGLARILWPPHGQRSTRTRARLAARMPWLRNVSGALRRGR